MKKVFLLLLLSVLLPVQAGLFDDIFSSSDDDEDRGPFYFKIKDDLKNGNEVSFEDRKLKIKMFFYTRYYNTIDNRDNDDLVTAFNANLEVTTQKEKDGPKDKLGQGLEFKFKSLPSQRSNDRYSLIVFESTKINITESQKLIFKFDQDQFAEDIGIGIDENIYKKTFNFKPLTIELKDLSLVNTDGELSIQGDFQSAFDIDVDSEEVSFDLFRNGKSLKTIAKKKKKKFNLEVSLANESSDSLTKLSAGRYRINVPINLSGSSTISETDIFTVKVPLLIKTISSSGLEIKIKSFVKTKLSDFLNTN